MNMSTFRDINPAEELDLRATGARKIYAFFEELIIKDSFIIEVRGLRKKYQIPLEGYGLDLTELESATENEDGLGKFTVPPIQWVGFTNDRVKGRFYSDLEKIEARYGLLGPKKLTPLELYVFYNFCFRPHYSAWQLCYIEEDRQDSRKAAKNNRTHPISMRISPYASSTDIVSFINRCYSSQLKPLQDKYRRNGFSIGDVRVKNSTVAERDAFIFSLKHLSLKKISGELVKRYGVTSKLAIDIGAIGKVLSLQRRKRK